MKLIVRVGNLGGVHPIIVEVEETDQMVVSIEDEAGTAIVGVTADPDKARVSVGYWPDGETWEQIQQISEQIPRWS